MSFAEVECLQFSKETVQQKTIAAVILSKDVRMKK